MSEHILKRDQENIYTDKRFQPTSSLVYPRRDIRSFEDRILQETQQSSQPNVSYSKPQRLSQEFSTSSGNSTQNEKVASIQAGPKASDKEIRQILRETMSPTASVGASDLSYRIVNEILNTQQGGRSQFKLKMSTRMADRKKSPIVSALTSLENMADILKETKAVFEENEELKQLQEKISAVKKQIQEKREFLETNKKKYKTETLDIEETGKRLKEEYAKLKERLNQKNWTKTQTKDKSHMNEAKDKLKQLRVELQGYEREMTRLKEMIEKQEKSRHEIEQRVAKGFSSQIEEFEDAIMSIEEQKVGIYAKLNEALNTHNQYLEQKAMLKEDLSGRLLQRADLVAQREDLEQMLESFRAQNRSELTFHNNEMQIKRQIESIVSRLGELKAKRQALKRQIEGSERVIGGGESQDRLDMEKIKEEWADLCDFEAIVCQKAEDSGLSGFEMEYLAELGNYGVRIDEGNVWEYMKEIVEEEETQSVAEIRLKEDVRKAVLERWKARVLSNIEGEEEPEKLEDEGFINKLSEFLGEKDEGEEFIRLFNELCQRVNAYQYDLETKVEETRNEENLFDEELSKIEQEIQESESKRTSLEADLNRRRDIIEQGLSKEAESAFGEYLEEQAEVFDSIKDTYGFEAAEETKEQHRREFIEITQNTLQKKMEHFRELKEELKYLEQVITDNTNIVDEGILPLLQSLLPSIEESAVLLSALKRQQMLLLETEDEVAGQLGAVFEQRAERIRITQEKYEESNKHSYKNLKEAKNMLEKGITPLRDEISRLETQIIETDKLSIEGIFEERKIYKELKDIEKEFGELDSLRKPRLRELETQLTTWDKEARDLEKRLEHLEMQKLSLEQQFVEQNYLGEDMVYQENAPMSSILHERSLKALNLDIKQANELDKQIAHPIKKDTDKEHPNGSDKDSKTKKQKGVPSLVDPSSENLDLSPIGKNRDSESPDENQQSNQKNELLNDLNQIGSPQGASNNWNCFSPLASGLMLGDAEKAKIGTSGKKDKSRERGDDSQKKEVSYLKNYQKRLIQRNNPGTNGNTRSNTAASLEARKKSLPQQHQPNLKRAGNVASLTQSTSPKESEAIMGTYGMSSTKDFNSTQNFSRSQYAQSLHENYNTHSAGITKGFESTLKKQTTPLGLEETISVYSPKALNLHINSLKAQNPGSSGLQLSRSLRAAPAGQTIYQNLIRQGGNLHEEIHANRMAIHDHEEIERLVEDDEDKDLNIANTRPRKSLSAETTTLMNEHGGGAVILPKKTETNVPSKYSADNFSFSRGNGLGDGNDLATRKLYYNSNGGLSEMKRGQEGLVPAEEDANRSKSTGLHEGRVKAKPSDYASEKLSHRDSRKPVSLEDLDAREVAGYMGRVGSPPGHKTAGRHLEGKESFLEFKARTIPKEQSAQEALFFNTIQPLLQGSLLYKKFTTSQSLKRAAFDPLMSDIYPPEACGYGVRSIRLHPHLDRIEIKHPSKPGVEITIPVESILRPVVPQITMDILRVQRKIIESHQASGLPDDKFQMAEFFGDLSTKALLAKRGVNSLNNGMERYLSCSHYSFSILLERNGKAEFVASSYTVFKDWIHGINMLLKYKKQLPKLRYKLKNYNL